MVPRGANAARNLWRQFQVLPPTSINQRRWQSLLRVLYLVNLFTLPIDLCFYHLRVRPLAHLAPTARSARRPRLSPPGLDSFRLQARRGARREPARPRPPSHR